MDATNPVLYTNSPQCSTAPPMVGNIGFEPMTFSTSRRHSPSELIAHIIDSIVIIHIERGVVKLFLNVNLNCLAWHLFLCD